MDTSENDITRYLDNLEGYNLGMLVTLSQLNNQLRRIELTLANSNGTNLLVPGQDDRTQGNSWTVAPDLRVLCTHGLQFTCRFMESDLVNLYIYVGNIAYNLSATNAKDCL